MILTITIMIINSNKRGSGRAGPWGLGPRLYEERETVGTDAIRYKITLRIM